MDEKTFEEVLGEALWALEDEGGIDLRRVDTFEIAGVLTTNNGLVVQLTDGSEFQVTIVKSA